MTPFSNKQGRGRRADRAADLDIMIDMGKNHIRWKKRQRQFFAIVAFISYRHRRWLQSMNDCKALVWLLLDLMGGYCIPQVLQGWSLLCWEAVPCRGYGEPAQYGWLKLTTLAWRKLFGLMDDEELRTIDYWQWKTDPDSTHKNEQLYYWMV